MPPASLTKQQAVAVGQPGAVPFGGGAATATVLALLSSDSEAASDEAGAVVDTPERSLCAALL